jgi:hypothetical protein
LLFWASDAHKSVVMWFVIIATTAKCESDGECGC